VARATVWLRDGALLAYLGRTERSLFTYLPAEEPARTRAGRELAQALSRLVDGARRRALLITSIDGQPPGKTALAGLLIEAGFSAASRGYLRRSDSQRARR
jgi:ATP-dependent Lhr-like helicase